jgi:putative ABC transport system permease protein
MFRSFLELRRVDPGYDPHGVLSFWVTRDWPLPRQQGRLELLRQIQDRLRALPGVHNVTAALAVPLGSTGPRTPPAAPARAPHASAEGADYQQVLPGYFETLRTRLLAGRTFTERDNAPGRDVAIVDDLLAARAFPGEPAVGQRIAFPAPLPPVEVIGVVKHQRLASLAAPGLPAIYVTDGSSGIGVSRYWMLRVSGDPASYLPAVRRQVAQIDRRLVISKVQTLDALVERDRASTTFTLLLIGTFAALAVLLATVGLYGVVAGAARRRTPEIGLRIALGADTARIFRMVVGQGLGLTALGVAAGLLAAPAAARALAGMLVGVRPTDLATFAAMAALFLAIGAAASWLPALRAARLDPVEALREE